MKYWFYFFSGILILQSIWYIFGLSPCCHDRGGWQFSFDAKSGKRKVRILLSKIQVLYSVGPGVGLSYYFNFLGGLVSIKFHIKWWFGTHGSWKNQNLGDRFGATLEGVFSTLYGQKYFFRYCTVCSKKLLTIKVKKKRFFLF